MPEHFNAGKAAPSPQRIRRLSFEYEGAELYKLGEDVIEAIPTESHPLDLSNSGAHWFEVRDADGNQVYRQSLPAHLGQALEHFHPDGSIARAGVIRSRGAFTIHIPEPETPQELVIHRPRRQRSAAGTAMDDMESSAVAVFPVLPQTGGADA